MKETLKCIIVNKRVKNMKIFLWGRVNYSQIFAFSEKSWLLNPFEKRRVTLYFQPS